MVPPTPDERTCVVEWGASHPALMFSCIPKASNDNFRYAVRSAADWCEGRYLGQVVHRPTNAIFTFYPRADAPAWAHLRLEDFHVHLICLYDCRPGPWGGSFWLAIEAVFTRRAISPEARRVKVISRIRRGSAPLTIRCATRWASVLVFPDPAPAMTRSAPLGKPGQVGLAPPWPPSSGRRLTYRIFLPA
jgi:hypothetical protein